MKEKLKKEELVEELGKELKEKKKMPKEELDKINKKVVINLIIACVIMLFFFFLAMGYVHIKKEIFITDLKVFAIGILAIAILLFENSYKKEDGSLCVTGIETLVLAIFTLVSVYVCKVLEDQFYLILPIASFVFAIYYAIKGIAIYGRMKKAYIKSLSDIPEIIQEEKPIKKLETKKRKKEEVSATNLEESSEKEKTTKPKKKKTDSMKADTTAKTKKQEKTTEKQAKPISQRGRKKKTEIQESSDTKKQVTTAKKESKPKTAKATTKKTQKK